MSFCAPALVASQIPLGIAGSTSIGTLLSQANTLADYLNDDISAREAVQRSSSSIAGSVAAAAGGAILGASGGPVIICIIVPIAAGRAAVWGVNQIWGYFG